MITGLRDWAKVNVTLHVNKDAVGAQGDRCESRRGRRCGRTVCVSDLPVLFEALWNINEQRVGDTSGPCWGDDRWVVQEERK